MMESEPLVLHCPRSWNDLRLDQLESLTRLMDSSNRYSSEVEWWFDIFLVLMDIEVVHDGGSVDVVKDFRCGESDAYIGSSVRRMFHFRGTRDASIRFSATAEQLYSWTLDCTSLFLDNIYSLTKAPYPFIEIPKRHWWGRGVKLQPPSNLLTNISFRQYTYIQRYMLQYWQSVERLRRYLSDHEGESPTPLMNQQFSQLQSRIRDARNRFLAHACCYPRWEFMERSDTGIRLGSHTVYEYKPRDAECFASHLDVVDDVVFKLVLQHVQSCLRYFSRQLPSLFSSAGSRYPKDVLMADLATVNAVMKYSGYTTQQSVYDTNAILVFDILNTMAKDAEETRRMLNSSHTKKS